jgi:hypothetical protein
VSYAFSEAQAMKVIVVRSRTLWGIFGCLLVIPAPVASFQDAGTLYYVYRGRHGEAPFAPGYYIMFLRNLRSEHSARLFQEM